MSETDIDVARTQPQRHIYYKAYEQPIEHLTIARLDSLHCDNEMAELPAWNKKEDVDSIVRAIDTIAPSVETARNFTLPEARAALRDLGMLMASVRRHGPEPETLLPHLVPVMLALGAQAEMVPRETIMHYAAWNPDGERQRCFTHYRDEVKIIQGTKMAIPGLERSVLGLAELYTIPLNSPDFASYARFVHINMAAMVKSIVFTIVNVNPRVFANDLRPYYDPFTLAGIEYMGAGAVQLPLFVFDHILWGSDSLDSVFNKFKEHNIPYCTPVFRTIYNHFSGKVSLVRKICHEIRTTKVPSIHLLQSVQALNDLLDVLVRFRTPHKSLANRAFSHRDETALGSGGYRPTILEHILDLTLEAKHDLKNALRLDDGR
jgi:hypothetical protein